MLEISTYFSIFPDLDLLRQNVETDFKLRNACQNVVQYLMYNLTKISKRRMREVNKMQSFA